MTKHDPKDDQDLSDDLEERESWFTYWMRQGRPDVAYHYVLCLGFYTIYWKVLFRVIWPLKRLLGIPL